jgi:protein O-GlcNAc transferase
MPPAADPLPAGVAKLLDDAQRALARNQPAAARAAAERAVAMLPSRAETHDTLRSVYLALGQPDKALPPALRAAELAPDHPGVLSCCADVLFTVGNKDQAVDFFRKALALEEANPDRWIDLAAVLLRLNRLIDAQELLERAIAAHPANRALPFRLASAYMEQGRSDMAARLLADALLTDLSDPQLAGFLCTVSNYMDPPDRTQIIARHRNFGRIVDLLDRQPRLAHTLPPARPDGSFPGRGRDGRLRVGFLSSDLRSHSVAFFAEPLLTALPMNRFEVAVFATSPVEDDTTRRLRAVMRQRDPQALWAGVARQDGFSLARTIADAKIDILIELNGLTAGNRYDALRFKPAPLIITYLGYPNTTGLSAIDLRIVDSITDPPAPHTPSSDAASTERLVRLDPCFLCYRPPTIDPASPDPGLPDPSRDTADPSLPAITFASFNTLTKLGQSCVETWSRVLHEVPGSRLLIKSGPLGDERTRVATAQRFARHNIDASRLILRGFNTSTRDHLAEYRRVDIALDTFPYAGTTTTCEAILMGVPVVSLCPPDALHATRVGGSLLAQVNLSDLAAPTPDAFVRTAVALARDSARRADLRRSLRASLLSSPLCNVPAFTTRFADTLTSAWQTHRSQSRS